MIRPACSILLLFSIPLAAQTIGNCPVFPSHNIWNTAVDKMPVHPASAAYIQTEGADQPVHPDFGPTSSLPYNIVPASQVKVPVAFDSGESDPGPYPIPAKPLVETEIDAHMLIVTQDECKLYEIFYAHQASDGSWTGGSGAIWDLRQNALRPDGWTSADAAGLPILPGLVRYDEVAAGVIRHALRITVPQTNDTYVWPGRHYASHLDDSTKYPPMGLRFRLKAGYDLSGFDPKVQVILQALKTYGAMVSDNGLPWYIQGAPDSRWDDNILAQLKQVHGSDLEAVDVSVLQGGPNSALANDPNASNRADTPFSATMNFDLSLAPTLSVTLAGDATAPTISNLNDGNSVTFLICQDGAGGHAFNWPANVVGGMQISTAAGTCSAQSFVSNGTKLYATTPGMTNM